MCIAIAKPGDALIPKETLETCFEANPDGAGYMFANKRNKEIVIKKGFFTFEDFWKEYQKDQYRKCAIHFRIKTHGNTDEDNCHPFSVNKSLAFIHNGIINNVDSTFDKTKSDTWHFNEAILKELPENFLYHSAIKDLIAHFIGYSKLVFLNSKGDFEIINPHLGTWNEKVWYSNNSFKSKPKTVNLPTYNRRSREASNKGYSTFSNELKSQVFKVGSEVESTITKTRYIIKSFASHGFVNVQEKGKETSIIYPINMAVLRVIQEEDSPLRCTPYPTGTLLQLTNDRWEKSMFEDGEFVEVIKDYGYQYIQVKDVYDNESIGNWEPRLQFTEVDYFV